MRSVATLVGTLATGGMLALMAPVPAFAASGTLTVDGTTYLNPGPGCYQRMPGGGSLIEVKNHTDQTVYIFGKDCGAMNFLGSLDPNSSGTFVGGGSVQVKS